MLRVGRHENVFILFLLAIKTAGSAQKLRVGRVSGNTAIFCLRLTWKSINYPRVSTRTHSAEIYLTVLVFIVL